MSDFAKIIQAFTAEDAATISQSVADKELDSIAAARDYANEDPNDVDFRHLFVRHANNVSRAQEFRLFASLQPAQARAYRRSQQILGNMPQAVTVQAQALPAPQVVPYQGRHSA